MKPSEELREQREAILRGTWVQRKPERAEEACLVARGDRNTVGRTAQRALGLALVELGWTVSWLDDMTPIAPNTNDGAFDSANDAIEALELAELIAKEAGL